VCPAGSERADARRRSVVPVNSKAHSAAFHGGRHGYTSPCGFPKFTIYRGFKYYGGHH